MCVWVQAIFCEDKKLAYSEINDGYNMFTSREFMYYLL